MENDVLQKRVQELTEQVKRLTIENATLLSEVEMYRRRSSSSTTTRTQQQQGQDVQRENNDDIVDDYFIRSGDGQYVKGNDIITISKLHGSGSNPLCCTLSNDDSVLITGGSDKMIRFTSWGVITTDTNETSTTSLSDLEERGSNTGKSITVGLSTDAPVLCCSSSPSSSSRNNPSSSLSSSLRNVVAVGCMDGTVRLANYEQSIHQKGGLIASWNSFRRIVNNHEDHGTSSTATNITHNNNRSGATTTTDSTILCRHSRYVRNVVWMEHRPILATSSADGCIQIYEITKNHNDDLLVLDDDDDDVKNDNNNNYIDSSTMKLDCRKLETLQLNGPIESMCFVDDELICYVRDTPYLSYFDLAAYSSGDGGDGRKKNSKKDGFGHRKINLNSSGASTGGFDSHVSYCIMDLKPYRVVNTVGSGSGSSGPCYIAAATDASRNIILDARCGGGGKQIRNLYGHTSDPLNGYPVVSWSQDGRYLMGNTQDSPNMYVWDISSSQIVNQQNQQNQPQNQHTQPIRAMYSSVNTNTVVTTSFDKTTKLWFL